jgi:hypothetical protein
MSLQALIEQGNYETPEAAFDAITTPIESVDLKAWTVADLAREFPPTQTNDLNTILGTLKAVPVFESAFIALSITGLELGSSERQAFIDQVAMVGAWPSELTLAVKRLGRPLKAPWESAGLNEPTLDDVKKAWTIAQCRKAMADLIRPVAMKSTAVNAWLDVLDTSEMTIAEIESYCSSLLASDDGNP